MNQVLYTLPNADMQFLSFLEEVRRLEWKKVPISPHFRAQNEGFQYTLTRNDDVDMSIDLSGLTGGTVVNYVNSASTTSTVGGITAGSTFPAPGKTMQEMWDLLLYPYQPPAFTSFNQSGLL